MFRPSTLVPGAPPALFLTALSIALALAPAPLRAADGFALCDQPGDQDSPSLALATDFATWVAWRDFRRSDATVRSDVYVIRATDECGA